MNSDPPAADRLLTVGVLFAAMGELFGVARDGFAPGPWDGQLRRAPPPACTDVVMFNVALQKVMDRCCDEPVSALSHCLFLDIAVTNALIAGRRLLVGPASHLQCGLW